jgi:hypothetical protein
MHQRRPQLLISLHRHGGLAAVPGLELKVSVDTADLPKDQAQELEKAVRAAALGDLSPVQEPARGGDRRIYELAVQDGTQLQSVTLTDPIRQQPLLDLIKLLTSTGRSHS